MQKSLWWWQCSIRNSYSPTSPAPTTSWDVSCHWHLPADNLGCQLPLTPPCWQPGMSAATDTSLLTTWDVSCHWHLPADNLALNQSNKHHKHCNRTQNFTQQQSSCKQPNKLLVSFNNLLAGQQVLFDLIIYLRAKYHKLISDFTLTNQHLLAHDKILNTKWNKTVSTTILKYFKTSLK